MEKDNVNNNSSNNIRFSFIVNLIFAIIEISGGIYANSLIILTNGIHDLGDSLSLSISWYLEKKSEKPPNNKFTYGFKRYSIIGAFINASILIGATFYIIIESVNRFFTDFRLDYKSILIFGILGFIFNGVAVLRLLRTKSFNEKMALYHLLDDLLGWSAAILIGLILKINSNLNFLDPLFSIIISIYILSKVLRNMKEVFDVFLQSAPKDINIYNIKEDILKIKNVKDIHDIHTWSLDGNYNILSLHITVEKNFNLAYSNELKQKIRDVLNDHNINHSTIEFCKEDEHCDYKKCLVTKS
ncbi:MAG: cation diffusion facilitator family transporter [Deferribacterota bacterium]|nr:cation diffusion facilitator family transporter [Deferribacterota bacterium]